MAGCDAVTRHGSLLQSVFVENILGIVGAVTVRLVALQVVALKEGLWFLFDLQF